MEMYDASGAVYSGTFADDVGAHKVAIDNSTTLAIVFASTHGLGIAFFFVAAFSGKIMLLEERNYK